MSNPGGCFWKALDSGRALSTVATLLGWQLIDAGDDQQPFRVRFEGKPEFRNPAGNIQGGMLAAMLDETLSSAAASRLGRGESPATLEMKVSFTARSRIREVVGEARVVSQGKKTCFLETQLPDSGGRLAAAATATAKAKATAMLRRVGL